VISHVPSSRNYGQDGASGRLLREVSPGWSAYPNLQKRPHAPNKGRGRLQVQIRRAFVGHRLRTSSQIYDWCYARNRKRVVGCWEHSVWRILRQIADPIGRDRAHGAIIWKLKEPLE
jgi:hypothetical protein